MTDQPWVLGTDRSRARAEPEQVSLLAGIDRTFLTTKRFVALMLTLTVLLAALLIGVLQPRASTYTYLNRDLRRAHEGMLDQETGARAWYATRDESFLEAVDDGIARLEAANADLMSHLGVNESVDRLILDLRLAQEAWLNGWAAPTLQSDAPAGDLAELDAVLAAGKVLFDDYRAAQERALADVARRRDAAVVQERNAMILWAVAEGIVCAAMLAVSRREKRQLSASVVAPLEDLLATIGRIRDGDLAARPSAGGSRELEQIGDGLADMSEALADERGRSQLREQEVERHAAQLQEILGLARDITGTLSVRAVAESAASAARSLAGAASCRLWLLDESSGALDAIHDTSLPRGHVPTVPDVELGVDTVGQAARDARTTVDEERGGGGTNRAIPLVAGARVVGVLEVRLPSGDVRPATADVLEMLAANVGAALEAARLHSAADELSTVDSLTRLHNRRRLDEDLESECARSLRYGRPLGFIMVDLDHFKTLNDTFGHPHGDEVLQRVAAVLTDTVRASDSVYRYGGEEFSVVVREGDRQAATLLAERLRVAIEAAFGVGTDSARAVTASFGVAALPFDASSPEALVSAADRALYAAKRNGRNQVAVVESAVAGAEL